MNLDALVAPLRADVVSGAAVVARTGAEVVRRALRRAEAGSVGELRDTLARLAVAILDAQPAMAPLVSLSARVLDALDGAEDVEAARRAAEAVATAFRDELAVDAEEVARRARSLIPDGGRVLTLSASSTVRTALVQAGAEKGLTAICLESRPMSEGQALAKQLADSGVRTLYAVDAAAACLMAGVDLVLLGADSVGDRGVVNKIGSRMVAEAARREDVPAYVLADRSKLLPPGFPQPLDDDRPEREVWLPPPGVRVWNRYFETVPLERFSGVVTGEGVLSAREVEERREHLPVPPELQEWADRRTGD